jgi:hypothetical protein
MEGEHLVTKDKPEFYWELSKERIADEIRKSERKQKKWTALVVASTALFLVLFYLRK